MMILETLATMFGVVTGLGQIPQIIKIFKTKSAKDLSIITVSIFATSSVIWLLYGLQLRSFPLVVANIIYMIAYIFIITGWIAYGRKSR